MAAGCEVMPHVSLVGDEAADLFDLTNESQMDITEVRYYPNMYTWVSMHQAYTHHVETMYNKRSEVIATRKVNAYRKAAQKRWPKCLLVQGDGKTAFTCKECAELKAAYSKTMDAKKQLQLLYCMKKHAHDFRRARQHYRQTLADALCNLHKILSIIIDGMDQNKCCCPRNCGRSELPKGCQTKFHVIGALVHGWFACQYVFLSEKWDQAKPQLTVTVLLSAIRAVYEQHNYLPETLKLQLDNPTGENKNHDVFAFIVLLVAWEIFVESYLSFCVPGHTHLDIDQCFSRYAVAFRKGHLTLEEFMSRITEGHKYGQEPSKVMFKDDVLNWHQQCAPGINKLDGISQPLLFRFAKDSTGAVKLWYKRHADKARWKGGLVLYTPPENPADATVVDWVPSFIDAAELRARVQKFEQHVPADQRQTTAQSWHTLSAQQTAKKEALCQDCVKHRGLAVQASTDAYGVEKRHKLLSEELKPTNTDALMQARAKKKQLRAECDEHIQACSSTNACENEDFEWLKWLAVQPEVTHLFTTCSDFTTRSECLDSCVVVLAHSVLTTHLSTT